MTNVLRLSLTVLLFCALLSASVIAQSPPCDPDLQPDNMQDELAYKSRDDGSRCEGIFIQDVASSALTLTSFTSDYELEAFGSGSLKLRWPVQGLLTFDTVSLRATSHVYKLYYRMDAVDDDARDGIYEWNIQIPSNLGLSSSDLGLLGWTKINLGEAIQDVVLPLAANRTLGTVIQPRTYDIIVMPQEELAGISYSVFKTQDEYVNDPEPIATGGPGSGYYPAGRPVPFTLDLSEGDYDEGIYYLEIKAELPDSRVSRLEIYFYKTAQ